MEPRDFIIYPGPVVDASRFTSVADVVTRLSTTDPMASVRSALNVGVVAQSLLTPSAAMLGHSVITPEYAASALTSLAALRTPYESITVGKYAMPYSVTASALSSAASIGATFKDLAAVSVFFNPPSQITQATLPSAAFTVGVADSLAKVGQITASYISSAKAAFAFESVIAPVAGSQAAFAARSPLLFETVSPSYLTALKDNIYTVSMATQEVWRGVSARHAYLTELPLSLLRAPGVELYATTQLAGAFSISDSGQIEKDDEIEGILDDAGDRLSSQLAGLDQGLVAMYRGGCEAIARGGTDWQRHALVSFRELLTHVLHRLAPDKQVLPLAEVAEVIDGRPTRRARLRFIFRAHSGPAIAKFFEADMKAAVELFDLLNNGTHRLQGDATKEQAHYLRGRIAGLLHSMLEACG